MSRGCRGNVACFLEAEGLGRRGDVAGMSPVSLKPMVGDVAGMGADLFESYVGSIIGTMILGAAMVAASGSNYLAPETGAILGGLAPILLPLVLGAIGIVTSILGTFLVKVKDGGDPHKALNAGEFASSFAMIVAAYFVIRLPIIGRLVGTSSQPSPVPEHPGRHSGQETIFGVVQLDLDSDERYLDFESGALHRVSIQIYLV